MAFAPKPKIQPKINREKYSAIRAINGRHPLQESVPGISVVYRVRQRKNADVLYFNFALAKEMGLLSKEHPEIINKQLKKVLLETFALQIVNEYDLTHNHRLRSEEISDHPYMATRYLQLQHPSRRGVTSGDGRSIWNGSHFGGGKHWDISSCGTGATCLSPATAIHKRFFRTGDPDISYGCGFADVQEGVESAIFSEILHNNGIKTERTLLILQFPNNTAINVRAGLNLLRPSHFFNHLRQDNLSRLRAVIDVFIERQTANKIFPKFKNAKAAYSHLLKYVCETFATIAAQFESDYIFCWLDWDGDNILADGGIIDYGSVRQFGLFHYEYRYNDIQRWSTNVLEQRLKAKQIVQTFAQAVDYLKSGQKKSLKHYNHHTILKEFDNKFQQTKYLLLLRKIGFDDSAAKQILLHNRKGVEAFAKIFSTFERRNSTRGKVKINDGITHNAVFSMRNFLREYPKHLSQDFQLMEPQPLVDLFISSYANRKDRTRAINKVPQLITLQRSYMQLIEQAALIFKKDRARLLRAIVDQSEILNRSERITGDAVIHTATKLLRAKNKMSHTEVYKLIRSFVESQSLVSDKDKPRTRGKMLRQLSSRTRSLLKNFLAIVRECQEGL